MLSKGLNVLWAQQEVSARKLGIANMFKSVGITMKYIQPQNLCNLKKNKALIIGIFSSDEQIKHVKISVMIQSNKCAWLLLILCFLKLKILAFHHACHIQIKLDWEKSS